MGKRGEGGKCGGITEITLFTKANRWCCFEVGVICEKKGEEDRVV